MASTSPLLPEAGTPAMAGVRTTLRVSRVVSGPPSPKKSRYQDIACTAIGGGDRECPWHTPSQHRPVLRSSQYVTRANRTQTPCPCILTAPSP